MLFKHPGKLRMHWLIPYVINYVMEEGVVQLQKLNGETIKGLVNGSRMKPYRDNREFL